jgi:hypothetical protein
MLGALAASADAQVRPRRPFVERGFVSLGAGLETGGGDRSDRILVDRNAEAGTIDAEYPGRAGVLLDVTAGMRVHGRAGIAVGVARTTRSGSAGIAAEIPHPFFDDQPRAVAGEAAGISRTETAVHGQVYVDLRPRGAWRIRLFGGPSRISIEQEVVTDVETEETYPYDTAAFRGAVTARAKGAALGFHAGLDVARLFTRRVGAGAVVRYARASVDLAAPAPAGVSTTGGGLQAGVGIRFLF